MREIGQWLAINGQAIDSTRPWKIFGEGPTEVSEGEFTDTRRRAHPQEFASPPAATRSTRLQWAGPITLGDQIAGYISAQAPGHIASVELLGCADVLVWSQDHASLTVAAPAEPPCDHAYALKIEFES